jgi:transcriptional regulator with XRE-family HTH domain
LETKFAISFFNCDFYQLLVCRGIGMMNHPMASKPLHPVITKLKAWRTARGLSQSQTIRALVAGGLPIKLGTLQQWERARSSPQVVTAAALERFLLEHHETPLPQKTPAPVVLRLKAWREAKNLSQTEAVAALVSAGVPAKLQTLQQWESGRRSPPAITSAALERFLHEHPSIGQHSAGR